MSERTCSKWVARYRAEGEAGLLDRSSAPRSIPHRTPDERVEAIVALRRLRMTGAEIAFCLAMALSTVSAVLLRVGLGKLSPARAARAAQPLRAPPPGRAAARRRQEARRDPDRAPGIASTAASAPAAQRASTAGKRQAGWEFVHVCVDDATRLAYVEVLADEKATTAVALPAPRGRLLRPPRHHRRARDDRQRLRPTAPPSTPSPAARSASATCAPGPTGRAPTARPSASSAPCSAAGPTARSTAPAAERTAALDGWLWTYNHRRPHGSLSHRPRSRASAS